MDLSNFFLNINFNGEELLVEVKPCCNEANVYYYDISYDGHYQFTITPDANANGERHWRISFMNADKQADDDLVQFIGTNIYRHSNEF